MRLAEEDPRVRLAEVWCLPHGLPSVEYLPCNCGAALNPQPRPSPLSHESGLAVDERKKKKSLLRFRWSYFSHAKFLMIAPVDHFHAEFAAGLGRRSERA